MTAETMIDDPKGFAYVERNTPMAVRAPSTSSTGAALPRLGCLVLRHRPGAGHRRRLDII